VLSRANRELQNRTLTRRKFGEFLGKQKRSLVAFEACATAHHWARAAQRHGHEVKIIPARAITPYRQGCGLNRSMQHLVSLEGRGVVADGIPEEGLLQRGR
jgi:transposase